jgi:hypothetical protein
MRLGTIGTFGIWMGLLLPQIGGATDAIPNCPAVALKQENSGNPGSLAINNAQVLQWKRTTENQRHERGHVQGNVVRVYPDRNGHEHFAIQIGPDQAHDTVEIIYNQDFGAVPDPQVGMAVEACGDYITSTAPSPGPNGQVYPASPDGAIVHWVHMAPDRSGHHSGFLMVNGVLTGQDPSHAGPRPPRSGHKEFNDYSSGSDFNSR